MEVQIFARYRKYRKSYLDPRRGTGPPTHTEPKTTGETGGKDLGGRLEETEVVSVQDGPTRRPSNGGISGRDDKGDDCTRWSSMNRPV